ncbi:hypothetical protein [Patulibacter americanus]|uniref:hypothetical protein n=1 Tax=Patulibacter americanus TaxID=588672 RepID=UPI0003B58406|nr:hypothetical protein [Patulibacter americanus]
MTASVPSPRRSGVALFSAVLAAGAVATVAATPASAAWKPGATPASATGFLLGDDRSASALLSGDGRYVVFETQASVLLGDPPDEDERYVGGIVRKDLVTGEILLVAPPQRVRREDGTPRGTGTRSAPSGISHDGRYVLFGTTARLAGADDRGSASPDVYLRDMTSPVSAAASYELVSAQDGGIVGADYADPAVGSEPGVAGYALSADGRRAVFVSRGVSTLPAAVAATTPAQQVWVRDLDARTTRLISRAKTDSSAAGTPAPQPAPGPGVQAPDVAISADGGKVVWMAGNAELQTPTLPREGAIGSPPALLWRDLDRITAPSRRVAGAADPDDPGCDPQSYSPSDTATGPCYGPFVTSEGFDQRSAGDTTSNSSALRLQGISGTGGRVLFSSSAYRRPYDVPAFRPSTAYLADMRAGLPRRTAVTVAWSNPVTNGRQAAQNGRLAADGRHATFVSRDNRFDGLQAVGSFPTASLLPFNVFSVDLDARTVELVTRAPNGSDYATESQTTTPPSAAFPSADGSAVAFPAPDGNLFVGDANGVEDVLVARTVSQGGAGGGGEHAVPPVLPAPPVDTTAPRALPSRYFVTLGRVVVSKRTGTATLAVRLPTGGRLTATARGTATRKVRGRKRSTTVTVGTTTQRPKRAGTVQVKVKVGAKARAALRRSPHRLAVKLAVTFRPQGAAPTSATRSYALRRAYVTAATPKKQRKTTKASAATRRTR